VIALIVGPTLVVGLLVSWYGYKTLVRIQRWGEKMNELDAIFQSVATPEEMAGCAAGKPKYGSGVALVVPARRVPVGLPH
jgi:hypothetical protein